MTTVMLFNATRSEETRAAIVRDGILDALEIDLASNNLIKGNIYKGRVANVEASLNACFVEIGAPRQGFLSVDDVTSACYHDKPQSDRRPRINEVIRRGKDIVVQVTRDSMGSKGSALTTQISLAGRFLVLMPYDDSRGISRKIEDEGARKKLKDISAKLTVPDGFGYIIRTAGLDQTKTALNRDVASLLKLWKRIKQDSQKSKSPARLYREGDLVVRMIRDYYSSEVDEIVFDTEEAAERAQAYFRAVMPRTRPPIIVHEDREPLFTAYGIEDQISAIYDRKVKLPSGGNICIDPTEALTAIDVNSAKATRKKSQEETALHTNLEAGREIMRQLRLRDLGGLLVVDFIDMSARSHNRQVEKAVKDASKQDKARTYIGKISDNGLLEINRQRIKQALQLRTHRDCPTCSGTGTIPSAEFTAMQILRGIDARASTGRLDEVSVDLHPEVADAFQNEFRQDLARIETENEIRILICARPGLHRTEQNISFKERRGGDNSKQPQQKPQQKPQTPRKDQQKPKQSRQRKRTRQQQDEPQSEPRSEPQDLQQSEPKPPGQPRKSRQTRRQAEEAGANDEPRKSRQTRRQAEEAAANDEFRSLDPESDEQPRLTKSQKRRLRRKRKAERDRQEAQDGTLTQDVDTDDEMPEPSEDDETTRTESPDPDTEEPDKKPARRRSSRRGRSRNRARKPAEEPNETERDEPPKAAEPPKKPDRTPARRPARKKKPEKPTSLGQTMADTIANLLLGKPSGGKDPDTE